jgi:hypothetical protein
MHRIPETGHILEFRRRILSYLSQQNNFDGPLVVHCWLVFSLILAL